MSNRTQTIVRWATAATKALKGKTIETVRYTTDEENAELGWSSSAPVIQFTDGTYVMASMDDEGNDAGALFTGIDGLSVIPVI